MAQSKSTPPQGPQHIDRRRAKMRRQPISRRRFWTTALVTAAVITAIPVVAGYLGYYFAVVKPRHQTIVRVNDQTFDFAYYVKQLRAIKRGTEQLGNKFDAAIEPFRLVEIIQENEIIRQGATAQGVTISKDEVDTEIEQRLSQPPLSFLAPRAPGQPITDPRFQSDLKEAIRRWTAILQLSEAEYRENVASDLRRAKMRDILGVSVPTVSNQVRFTMVKLNTDDQQGQALVSKRVKDNDDLGAIAHDLSTDEESALREGDVGWAPPRVYPELDDLLFGIPPDTIAPYVQAPEGFYLVQVEGRQGDQARLRVILAPTEQQLFAIGRRVTTGGESFEAVAREVNPDPALKASGGDLGLLSEGARGGIFDAIIRGADVGEVIGPRQTTEAIYWIKVTDRARLREIEEKSRDVLKTRALEDWVKEQQSKFLVQRTFNSDIYAMALEEIRSREEQAAQRQQAQTPTSPFSGLPAGG
ncbi:MAG: peptidylprolyl isomerase [Chloroflexi bacterium]|nr:peptidylprolyl isomerase [Chloroflexota bacterium]